MPALHHPSHDQGAELVKGRVDDLKDPPLVHKDQVRQVGDREPGMPMVALHAQDDKVCSQLYEFPSPRPQDQGDVLFGRRELLQSIMRAPGIILTEKGHSYFAPSPACLEWTMNSW